MNTYRYEAFIACPDCGAEIVLPVTVRLSIQTDDGVPVVLVATEPDTDAAWAHYAEFHMAGDA